jgi:uncharacterized protein YgiM (DUF1202 family)
MNGVSEMRRFFQTTAGKIIIALAELAVLVALVSGVILLLEGVGLAEDVQYVICMDRVNVRMGASSRSDEVGWLEPGDVVYLDGRKKGGFVHCEIPSIEAGEGWVHRGYLVDEPPEKMNRTGVITGKSKVQARKNVDGKRTRWLKPGGEVRVYWWTSEWCLTNCGYVKSAFIELDGE